MTLATAGIPAITDLQPTMTQIATGTHTGDGSTIANVLLGFTPKMFKLFDMTNGKSWEWVQGMPTTNSIYHTAGADIAIDANTVIKTNGKINVVSSVGVYDPNQGGANTGVLINTTLNVWGPDPTATFTCQLSTNGLVNNVAYVWYALG